MAMDERNAWSPATVIRTTLIVGGLALLAFLAWRLADVLLLFCAAAVGAVILRSVASAIEKVAPLSARWSLAIACLAIGLVIVGFFVLLGAQFVGLFRLLEQVPGRLTEFGQTFDISNLGGKVEEQARAFVGRGGTLQQVAGLTSGLVAAVADVILVLVAAIYLAARPEFYRRGLLRLCPEPARHRLDSAALNAGRALRLWLFGQLVAMVLVGTLITIGLYLLAVPSAASLGLLAGLAEFVPIVGPILSAVPALLVAFSQGGTTVFWVLGLFVLVQQLESNVIMPLVQRRTVDLPPVLTLFSLLALGILFGPLGVLLATPLTVVLYVAIKQLYLRDTLHEPIPIPGEPEPKQGRATDGS